MLRRRAQKKLKRRQLTVCQECNFTPFDPIEEAKPSNMKARLVKLDDHDKSWVVKKTCIVCGDFVYLGNKGPYKFNQFARIL